MRQQLQRWWAKKFKLPWNHELFEAQPEHELLVQFYEDYFEARPIEAHRQADGHIQFKHTGDDLIDRWEEQLARGEDPNLQEAFNTKSLQRLSRFSNRERHDAPRSIKETVDSIGSSTRFSPEELEKILTSTFDTE